MIPDLNGPRLRERTYGTSVSHTLLMPALLIAAWGVSPAVAAPQAQGGASTAPNGAPAPASPAPASPVPANKDEIGFSADALDYDDNTQIVTATGNVVLSRDGNHLRADKVVWNRQTGKVEASGNVSAVDQEGNIAYGDKIDVTDSLKDGVVANLLLVMEEGGRLAAARGQRVNGIYTLSKAAYSPCPVVGAEGCPKEPSWQIKAVRIIYNPERQRVSYRGARLELFGVPIAVLPTFSHPVGGSGRSGFLVPDIGINGVNGFEVSTPYFIKLAPNRDLTITPYLYTSASPMLGTTYQALLGRGAYRISGFATYGNRQNATGGLSRRDLRGYFDASGKFQIDPNWSVSGSTRWSTDRTFLRRYNISRDDRLRSTIQAERIGTDSYFSIAGWAVQTLRANDKQGQMPIALPAIDYRLRLDDPLLGGKIQLQANSLAITRTQGQDTQRAFVGAQWNLRRLTGLGQEVSLTGYARGDVYHSSDNLLTSTVSYRGRGGWQTRGIAAAAADVRWPFFGEIGSGTQRITPRVQIVAAPRLSNIALPNEDARSIELEDSNLFALNRFPGYDRFEDSSRVTYGVEYSLTLPGFTLDSVVGQSYRLNRRPSLFVDGTGLTARASDVVGRTTIRYRDFVSLTHRFRLDKDSLSVRRNELDATIGTRQTYVIASYLRLNRNISAGLEDLSDREEMRVGGRVQVTRYWSLFGSTVVDLTGPRDVAVITAATTDGFSPVRHRLGVAYQDDCLELSFTWRRDYQAFGDAGKNNSFHLRLAFRNLGI